MDRDPNLLLLTDSYKVSHHKQYPPGTQTVYSYFESRGGEFPHTVFFGLQYFLDAYLAGPVVTHAKIDQAEQVFSRHFGGQHLFNRAGWEHILQSHSGRLPVRIKSIPEGTVVPTHQALLTIENTDPACYWLTNYLESLLVQVWYPSTVATQSHAMKQTLSRSLDESGTLEGLPFKLHDFGFRGSSSVESAALGGAAHLVNFLGTDNLAAIVLAQEFYGADMPGFSIPAAEHSTLTAWGREHEAGAYRNMLEQFPTGLVAVVSDSYDVFHACEQIWGRELKADVLRRQGTLVVRPDSGNPCEVVVRCLNLLGGAHLLGRALGSTLNAKGYRVLDSHVRLLQGDGIDRHTLGQILAAVQGAGWSADNVAFGSGGGLLQKVNRDTCRWAFKCSSVTVDGRERDVFKQPVTDQAKSSKAGRLKLVRRGDSWLTLRDTPDHSEPDQLQQVFLDGQLLGRTTWNEVRARAELR